MSVLAWEQNVKSTRSVHLLVSKISIDSVQFFMNDENILPGKKLHFYHRRAHPQHLLISKLCHGAVGDIVSSVTITT